jgi:hypothetical protein
MTMPGVSATVGEQIEALRKAGGDKAVALIKRVDDPFVSKIVQGWAGRYDAKLATSLGFKAEKNFDEIIKVYQDDEMGPMRFSRRGVLPTLAGGLITGSASAQPVGGASPLALKLVVLDIGGTLIGDHGEVPDAMLGAFSRKGHHRDGRRSSAAGAALPSGGMVKALCRGAWAHNRPHRLEEAIYVDFTATVSKAYANVQPIPGAENALKELQGMKLLLATTTGFDRALTTQVLSHLGWQHYFAASITSDDVGRWPPRPVHDLPRHGSRPCP